MENNDREIRNLIASYAFRVDDGDFAGLADLLADAGFTLNGTTVRGREQIERFAHDTLRVHADGTPRTRHVTTNIYLEIDDGHGSATSRSYFTVFQAVRDFPLQPIAAGRYHDRFELREGRWRFAERDVLTLMSGDTSHHVR